MTKNFATGLLFCAFCLPLKAQNELKIKKLDSLFAAIQKADKGMGSVAITQNGVSFYTHAQGFAYRKDGKDIAADTDTRYRIGSITKIFTAVLIFQLIEEQKLTLSTTLDTYFPTVPNAKTITIGQMLSHRSGIYNFTEEETYLEWNTQPHTPQQILDRIVAHKPFFEPNAKAGYSNSNYILLGNIAEKITNDTYKNLVQKRIVNRIALKNTYVGGKTDVNNHECFSFSQDEANKWVQESETDMSVPQGAGAIVATAADLTQFIIALFDGKLVSATSLTQMQTINESIGMGLFAFPFNEKKGLGHTGGIDGFSSIVLCFPKDSLAVAYCSNGGVFSRNDILLGVLKICYDQPYPIPDFTPRKSINLSEEDLQTYIGTYSSAKIPLKIIVKVENGELTAQATGQGAFPLRPIAAHTFDFEAGGIQLIFKPENSEMTLRQGGGAYLFKRE